jgi:cardiolipin synthase
MKVQRSFSVNIPNVLSILRVLLTPLFAIFLIKHLRGSALLVFAIAALSDCLDGLMARVLRQSTTLGSYLDPAADKLLLLTAFVTLAIQELIPSWLAVIVITRDILILVGVALFTIIGREFQPRPSMLSKITTVAQIASVISVLAGDPVQEILHMPVQEPLFWFAAAMTMISGFQYIYRGLNILQEEPQS